MNVALNDVWGDGYGVFANPQDAVDYAEKAGFKDYSLSPTSSPVNNGNDPENLGECNSHDGVHQFQNDPDPCIDWTDV